MDQWTHEDCLQFQIFFLPDESFNLQKTVCRGTEVRVGEGWESENNGKEKTASAGGIHCGRGKCALLPNLAGSMFGCHRSTLFVLFPRHWTKECIVGKPIMTYDTLQRKITAWGSIKGLTWPWCTRAQHGAAWMSGSSNGSPGAICTILLRAPGEAPSSCKLGQRGEQRPCPLPGDTQREAFQKKLSKKRKNYTQILEENWNGFLKRI